MTAALHTIENRDLQAAAQRAVGLIDLTSLNDPIIGDDVVQLCDRAQSAAGPVAAVCVWPVYAAICRSNLRGTGIKLAVVINFPGGSFPVDKVLAQIEEARQDDIDEIDIVMAYHDVILGTGLKALERLQACRDAIGPLAMKTVLETGTIAKPSLIAKAARIAIDAGSDFLVTSTDKVPVGATLGAARILLAAMQQAGRPMGLKIVGHIRDVLTAHDFMALADDMMGPGFVSPANFRFGTCGLLDDLLAELGHRPQIFGRRY